MKRATVKFLFFVFCMISFNANIKAETTATATPTTPQTEWRLLDASIAGNNVAWKDEWMQSMQQAKTALDSTPFSCLEVTGYEDIEKYGRTKQEQLEIRVAGGEEPLRQDRARKRMIFVMKKLRDAGVAAFQVREGIPQTSAPKGQRGAVVTLILDCLPKPVPGPQGPPGEPAKAEVNITYDLTGQYLYSPARDNIAGTELRVNLPIGESLSFGVGLFGGLRDEWIGLFGLVFDVEWDWSRWFKPRFSAIARADDIDLHGYFGRGEIGIGAGFVSELYQSEAWAIISEMRLEVKGDVEAHRDWQRVNSGALNLGVRF